MKFTKENFEEEVKSAGFNCYDFLADKNLDSDTDEFYKKIINELLEFGELRLVEFSKQELERYMLAWLYSGHSTLDNGILGIEFVAVTIYFNLLRSVNGHKYLPVQHFDLLMRLSDKDFNELVKRKGVSGQIGTIHFGDPIVALLGAINKLRDIIYEI